MRTFLVDRLATPLQRQRAYEHFELADREREILALIGEGLTNRDIGKRLYLAEKTVKNHISRLLAKLGVERRVQAAVIATQALGTHDTKSDAPHARI
jgi:two-component system response regulator DevR